MNGATGARGLAVPVVAVETLGQGRVWLDPALSARDQECLAAAMAVLLLY